MEDEVVALIDVQRVYSRELYFCVEGPVVGDLTGDHLAYSIPLNRLMGMSVQINQIDRVGDHTALCTQCDDEDTVDFLHAMRVRGEVLQIWRLSKERYDNLAIVE